MEQDSATTKATTDRRLYRARWLNYILGIALVISLAAIFYLPKEESFLPKSHPVPVATATDFVINWRNDLLRSNVSSFLVSTTQLARLLHMTVTPANPIDPNAPYTPPYLHVFHARNAKNARTLVLTGARFEAAAGRYINTHFDHNGTPHDLEHIFPCVDEKCKILNEQGEPENTAIVNILPNNDK